MIFNVYYGSAQSDFPYQQPDNIILALADAKPAPTIRLKYDASLAILLYRNAYKSIDELSSPEMKLAGIRVNPMTNAPGRTTYFIDIKVLDIATSKEQDVQGLPSNGKFSNIVWSNDQSKIAFTNTVADGTELWYLDIKTLLCKNYPTPLLMRQWATYYYGIKMMKASWLRPF